MNREKPPFGPPMYATRVGWRYPGEWKMHTSRRAARAAMSYHEGPRELWEFREGDWHFVEERSGR